MPGSGEAQLQGSSVPSPAESSASDTAAPTLLPHIKQEIMPPGSGDFIPFEGIPELSRLEPDTYISDVYKAAYKDFRNSPLFVDERNKTGSQYSSSYERYSKVEELAQGIESLNSLEDKENPVPPELVLKNEGIYARTDLPEDTRYGPFTGKWVLQPIEKRFAWEIVSRNGVRQWLDGSREHSNWMKLVRSTSHAQDSNVQYQLRFGQVWYRLTRTIRAGEELLLPLKSLLTASDALTDLQDAEAFADAARSLIRQRTSGVVSACGSSGTGSQDNEEEEDREETEPRCSVCDAPFPDIDVLDNHLVHAHGQPQNLHRCDRCPRAYSSRVLLLRHRAIIHSDLRKYPCENCPKRHIRAQHVGARSHACPECGKTFGTSSGLKQHTHIHSSVKPFQCKVCFKAYTQFSNLCRHKRMHVACRAVIYCAKCGQSFTTCAALTKHKRFCDPASTEPGNPPSQVTQGLPHLPNLPNANMNNQLNPSFPLYRPSLPFPFPFGHYPGLFQAANPHGLFNPLLFNHQRLTLAQDMLPKNDRRTSITSLDSTLSNDEKSVKLDVETSQLSRDSSKDKLSPNNNMRKSPMNHEILTKSMNTVSETNPLPSLSLHREESRVAPKFDFTLNTNNNEPLAKSMHEDIQTKYTKPTLSETKLNSSKSDNDNKQDGDQPLDLSISRKRTDMVNVCEDLTVQKTHKPSTDDSDYDIEADDRSYRNSSIKSYSPSESPTFREKTPENDTTDVDVEAVELKPDDSRVAIPSSPLAYPRPVHHSLLDAMYRPDFSPFRPPTESMLTSPHGPYVPPFNFLSPLLADGPDRPQAYAKFREMNGAGKLRDRYACKFCGKVFPRSANLTRHLRTHTGEQPYKCKYCERSFSISSNLQRHVRNIHNKERPFRCPLCDRCFGQQTNLDRHLKKHEAEGGDSPSSVDTEREDTYFDEIRSFMGKVACSPARSSPSPAHSTQPQHRPSALVLST